MPSKISSAIQHVHDTLEKIKKLSEEHVNLNKSVDKYEKKVLKIKTMAADYIDKINALEKASDYLEIIKKMEEISNSLESAVNDKNEKKQIANYQMLCVISQSLCNTKCVNLMSYATETIHYWHNILKEKYSADLEEILKALKWPFVGSVLATVHTVENISRFQLLIEYLIQIELYPLENVSVFCISKKFA